MSLFDDNLQYDHLSHKVLDKNTSEFLKGLLEKEF